MAETLLEARNLKKHFPVTKGQLLSRVVGQVKAVDGVSFTVEQGTTFGVVGESGCGKTTTARLILRLEDLTTGTVLFDGVDVAKLRGSRLKEYRTKVQAVFQDPYGSLNPRMRVGEIVGEPLLVKGGASKWQLAERVGQLLDSVGLAPDSARLFPHEFSGGQRQRIAVARALSVDPSLIVLDEPVSALDVSIRAQLMNLLRELQGRLGLTYLLIAHDLAVVRHMCQRVAVMYLGKIVELASSDELYGAPLHPYTRALLAAALPSRPRKNGHEEIILGGEVPSPLNPPNGCHFHPRCAMAMAMCAQSEPPLLSLGDGHQVACYLHR